MNLSRREALKKTAVLGAAATIAPGFLARAQSTSDTGDFSPNPLPYAFNALEPAIDERTMQIHYEKHYAGYVRKLNAALQGVKGTPTLEDLFVNLQEVPESARTAVQHNGGGTYNHGLFWDVMQPPEKGSQVMPKDLLARIRKDFGGVEEFQEEFSKAAGSVFGSGWAWLILREQDGKLAVVSTSNQDNPLMKSVVGAEKSGTPLLGLDVWEHAYYLHYQNRRTDYIANWWKVVNWSSVEKRFGNA